MVSPIRISEVFSAAPSFLTLRLLADVHLDSISYWFFLARPPKLSHCSIRMHAPSNGTAYSIIHRKSVSTLLSCTTKRLGLFSPGNIVNQRDKKKNAHSVTNSTSFGSPFFPHNGAFRAFPPRLGPCKGSSWLATHGSQQV